jgi:hypothetical protein
LDERRYRLMPYLGAPGSGETSDPGGEEPVGADDPSVQEPDPGSVNPSPVVEPEPDPTPAPGDDGDPYGSTPTNDSGSDSDTGWVDPDTDPDPPEEDPATDSGPPTTGYTDGGHVTPPDETGDVETTNPENQETPQVENPSVQDPSEENVNPNPTTQPDAPGSGFIMQGWMKAAFAGLLALAVGSAAVVGGDL